MLYRGPEPVEHAAAAVREARAVGMRLAYVTNNASRSPQEVAAHLSELGIASVADDVVTSGQAAARRVAVDVPAGSAVLVLGTPALADLVQAAGLRPVRTLAQAGAAGVAAVVQGLGPQTSMADLSEAARALYAGALWIVGNTDPTLPSPNGMLPGNGAFVEVLRSVTGREPSVAGKPDPALHIESVQRVSAVRPLVVGDRLDTDVLGAVRGGADSLLVLTGVTDLAARAGAPAGMRPTYVSGDLRGLAEPHPPVVVDGDVARCRAALARLVGGRVVAEGGGDDAVRAEVSLAWALADRDG